MRFAGAMEAGLRWWLTELSAMAPPRLRQWVSGHEAWLEFHDPESLAESLRHREFSGRHPVLVVAEANLLRKPLTLPAAAAENLRQVLAFEMDRQTPFTAASVLYGHRLLGARDGFLRVELVVTPRPPVEEALAALSHHGLIPSRVVAGTGSDCIGLAPSDGPLLPNRRDPIGLAFAALGLGLAIACLLVPLELKRHRAEDMSQQASQRGGMARAQAALSAEIERLAAQERQIYDRKRAQPAFVVILDEISRLLADDTWVHQLEWRGGELQLTGSSAQASALISVLENSPVLREVNFRSPVTQDGQTGFERFHLSARMEPPP